MVKRNLFIYIFKKRKRALSPREATRQVLQPPFTSVCAGACWENRGGKKQSVLLQAGCIKPQSDCCSHTPRRTKVVLFTHLRTGQTETACSSHSEEDIRVYFPPKMSVCSFMTFQGWNFMWASQHCMGRIFQRNPQSSDLKSLLNKNYNTFIIYCMVNEL